ncbi:sensor domain-containing diguanylate cyclase [Pseudomonas japonica]|uniref:sensor domain-containing diguanylate cyclase n=1 Tax=Pseudomonas japonica TaxID=256466 RepID=UPI0015E48B4E|nr:diguanylate cyclase [Pseudomonas japonica]MBA1290565.1 diguanylate cyclase [Pseudomonas japonica]
MLFWTNQTRTERNNVELQLDHLRVVQGLLIDAETGERGYALTGNELFLQPYYLAKPQIPAALLNLRLSYANDTDAEAAAVEDLVQHAYLVVNHIDGVVQLRASLGAQAALKKVASGDGKRLMDHIREQGGRLVETAVEEIAARDDKLNTALLWAVAISSVSFVFTLLLGCYLYLSLIQSIRGQKEVADRAVLASNALTESIARLERRHRGIGLLAEMAGRLQTQRSKEDVLTLVSGYCQQMLEASSGEVFLYCPGSDVLQSAVVWGNQYFRGREMESKECWGIYHDHVHVVIERKDRPCAHYALESDPEPAMHSCLPLNAHEDMQGLMHIRLPGTQRPIDPSVGALIEAVAEQTAIALASVAMRRALHTQAIRDPQTGLYNLGVLEKTLERELERRKRSNAPLSVIMLELDDFEVMKVRYGRSASDAVLRATASLLLQSIALSEVVCRLSGERFLVIMPDCSTESAILQAEALRSSFGVMRVMHEHHPLFVTASFGVASASTSTTDRTGLLESAATALERAKEAGKNRVVASSTS